MRCRYDVTQAVTVYTVSIAIWLMAMALIVVVSQDSKLDTNSVAQPRHPLFTQFPWQQEVCCSGVLGYASESLTLNFPCQNQPCCNNSDTVTVVPIDFAKGFMFQCMPRKLVQPLCYETGAEVRSSNQDPDFIPRACCQGLKFKVLVNQWYAAMVIKCVEEQFENRS